MAIEPLRIASELRAWAGEYRWHHAATLTTRHANSVDVLLAEVARGFIRRLENKSRRYVAWFCVFEQTHAAQWHAHTLLAGTEDLSQESLRWAWKRGLSKTQRIYSAPGAIGYITKHVDSAIASGADIAFDFSAKLLTHEGSMVDRR
jgi:hypothetical protein